MSIVDLTTHGYCLGLLLMQVATLIVGSTHYNVYQLFYAFNFFFLKEFQLMTSTPDDSALLSNQDINQFLV